MLTAFASLVAVAACGTGEPPGAHRGTASESDAIVRPHDGAWLAARLAARLDSTGAEYGLAFRDLGSGTEVLLGADRSFHAASMMKVPVMVRIFRMVDAGQLSLADRIPVRNAFRSIENGSPYALSPEDDSDSTLYARVGERASVRELVDLMITRSSNLATNLLVQIARPDSVRATLEALGVEGVHVLRGVEDIPAYRAGHNNTATARGLMDLFTAIVSGQAAEPQSTTAMLDVLTRQEFDDAIPAGLPRGVPVAHKTGWITAVDHDGGIVLPPGEPPYVLVVLTSGVQDEKITRRATADVSRMVWKWTRERRGKAASGR
jgi:beta-lactamase class A